MGFGNILGLAFIAAFAMTPRSNAATLQETVRAKANPAAAELVIRGRILREVAEPLPKKAGPEIVLASLWTYEIRVARVLRGEERNKMITAVRESDPALRTDKDLVFDLVRRSDGIYQLRRLQVLTGRAFEALAGKTDVACPDAHIRFFYGDDLGAAEDTFEESLTTSDQLHFQSAIEQGPDGVPPSCNRRVALSCSVPINHLEAMQKAGQMERFVGFICAARPHG